MTNSGVSVVLGVVVVEIVIGMGVVEIGIGKVLLVGFSVVVVVVNSSTISGASVVVEVVVVGGSVAVALVSLDRHRLVVQGTVTASVVGEAVVLLSVRQVGLAVVVVVVVVDG